MITSTESNQTNTTNIPNRRNRIIVFSAIVISIIAVILVLFFLINFLVGGSSSGKVYPSITPTSGLNVTNGPVSPTKSAVNLDARIALKVDGDQNHGGSLWLINYNNTEKVKAVNENTIGNIYSWSPDNRFLAVTLISNTKDPSKRTVAAYDISTSTLLKSNIDISVSEQLFWKNNNTLVAVKTYNDPYKRIYFFTLPEFNYEEYSLGIEGADVETIRISNNIKWAFATGENSVKNNEPLIYNLSSETTQWIYSLDLVTGSEFFPISWNPANKFVYFTHEGFFELDPESMLTTQLFSFYTNLMDTKPGKIITYSPDQKNLYFFINTLLYRYSFTSRTTKELFDINELPLNSTALDNFWISPSEKYLTLTAGINPSYLVNLDNGKSLPLCELTCYDPVWQN